ncbi:MAG: zinc ribbon domain-containing protein, partial [Nitrososphaera sp.]
LVAVQPPELEQKIEPPKPAAQEVEKPKEEERAIACRYCGFASVPPVAKFCPDCGKDLKAETNVWKMCPACDVLTTNDAAFCSACRQKFPETLS